MSNISTKTEGIRAGKLSIAVVMTGGTIAKSYDPSEARLHNYQTKIKDLISDLRLDDLELKYVDLMQLDSLDIGDPERARIVEQVNFLSQDFDGVLVTHGTDGMSASADALCASFGTPVVPVVFTGAMVPYTVNGSDAVQNVTEALLALRLLPAGVYLAFHNRILSAPGIRKDYDKLTFAKAN